MDDTRALALAAEHLARLGRTDSAAALLKGVPDAALSPAQRTLRDTGAPSAPQAPARPEPEDPLAVLAALPAPDTPPTPVPGRVMYLLHHSLPYYSNGYAARGHGMACGMVAAGLDLVCLTRPGFPVDIRRDLDSAPAQDRIGPVTYHRLPAPRWTGPGRSRTYIADAAAAIEKQLRIHRPRALIAASNHVAALPALVAARRCAIPMAYEVRGFWEITAASRHDTAPTAETARKTQIDSQLAQAADHVFTLSDSMKAELVRRGVPADRITLLPNCCDPERFVPRPRDAALAAQAGIPDGVPVIGYVGSFVEYEGLDDLTRACGALHRAGHDFRLLLVGASDGPVVDRIRTIAAHQGITERLIMPGRVAHDAVDAWYSLIDIAPFPRKPLPVTELVTPLKPLEAMAMEKAVVVSSVAAMAEVVEDNVTGLVFEKGDADALAGVLGRLVTDTHLRVRLSRAARGFVGAKRTWAGNGMRVQGWMHSIGQAT